MKHIKEYSIFEVIDQITETLEDVKDICLELEDKGYMFRIRR